MQGFLADMETFSIEEAAALIANKYGWHEGGQQSLLMDLLERDADTAPLGLSNPQPFGCELAGDEIVCEETGATLPFIRFDVDIPENAGFLQFDYTFTGADRAVSGAEGVDTPGRSDGTAFPRYPPDLKS
jgi:hypothetical protein